MWVNKLVNLLWVCKSLYDLISVDDVLVYPPFLQVRVPDCEYVCCIKAFL